MNIIELFEELKIDKSNILLFSPEDIIRIEKQVNVQKRINQEIDAKTRENLILALKEYQEELLFILSNRILFNFFTHNNFSKNHFSDYNLTVSDEKMKSFIALFLADDLISFFSFKLSKNTHEDLEELDFLLDFKRYFSEEIIYKMSLLLFSKLDFAISQLSVSTNTEFSNIVYIKYTTFYDLLSHFATIELDRKVVALLNLVSQYFERMTNVNFCRSVIKSMASYNAFIESISKLLIEGREILMKPKKDVDDEKMHLIIKIILAVIFLFIAFHKLGYY